MKASRVLTERWQLLVSPEKMTLAALAKSLRYGLIAGANPKSGWYYRCLACRDHYMTRLDAQTHPCSYEDEFRLITGRCKAAYDRRRAGGETTEHVPKAPPLENPNAGVGLTKEHAFAYFDDMANANRRMMVEIERLHEVVGDANYKITQLEGTIKARDKTIEGFDRVAKESREINLTNQEAKTYRNQR